MPKPDAPNVFLSEFDDYRIMRRLVGESWNWALAAAWFAAALVVLWLGHRAGANCLCAEVGPPGQKPILINYGYLAELNHALLYVVGGPALIALGRWTLHYAQEAFRGLAGDRRLTAAGDSAPSDPSPEKPIELVREQNRKVFVFALWVIPAFAVGVIILPELLAIEKPWFGWVQTRQVPNMHGRPLANDIQLDRAKEYFGVRHEQLIVTFRGYEANAFKARLEWLPVFLATALLLESALTAYVIWLALKVCFIIWVLARASWVAIPADPSKPDEDIVPPWFGHLWEWSARMKGWPILGWLYRLLDPGYRLTVRVNPEDPERRFGLKPLDPVYNLMLVLGIIGAVNFAFGQLSNLAKGTCWTLTHDALFFGRLLVAVLTIAPVVLICAYPVFRSYWFTREAKRRRLVAIEDELKQILEELEKDPQPMLVVELQQRKDKLNERKERVEKNRCWPLSDSRSKTLAAVFASVIIAGFPLVLQLVGARVPNKEAAEWVTRAAQWLPGLFCGCGPADG